MIQGLDDGHSGAKGPKNQRRSLHFPVERLRVRGEDSQLSKFRRWFIFPTHYLTLLLGSILGQEMEVICKRSAANQVWETVMCNNR